MKTSKTPSPTHSTQHTPMPDPTSGGAMPMENAPPIKHRKASGKFKAAPKHK